MIGKRFEINNNMNFDSKVETYELSCIVDNENKTFYFVVDSIANVELFIERLNNLVEENEELKKEAEEYNEDAMSYQTLYAQQVEKNEELKKELREIKDFYKDYEPMWETVSIKEVIG